MSYKITVVIPDIDDTHEGLLILPGEPIASPFRSGGAPDCSLCDQRLDQLTHTDEYMYGDLEQGDHSGVIEIPGALDGGMSDYMHLRCVLDSGQQYHSIGFVTEVSEITHTGRHLRSA